MKNLLLITTIICSSSTLAISACDSNNTLKGSDLISTDVGTTYTYQNISQGTYSLTTTVASCNNQKTQCTYKQGAKDSSGHNMKVKPGEYNNYINKDGSVDSTIFGKKSEYWPAKIEPNKVSKTKTGSYEFTKLIPEIKVNGTSYKNCVQLVGNSELKQNDTSIKVESTETYCKGIGLVKESVHDTKSNEVSVLSLISVKKPKN